MGRCPGSRGRSIGQKTKYELFALSAGFCQKPECHAAVFPMIAAGKTVNIAEAAHIVAAAEDGPRGDTAASDADLTSIDNLILLCPTCHTIVDRAPDVFPKEEIMRWKQTHEDWRVSIFGVRKFKDRANLRRELNRYLLHSKQVHALLGPESEAVDPSSENAYEQWRAAIQSTLIPNNEKIISLLERNAHLLTLEEQETLAQFKLHAEMFARRHLYGEVSEAAPRYPTKMDAMAEA